jgi:hypothetical protein
MDSTGPGPSRGSAVLAATVLALYVLAFPYHPGLRSPNELCRLWQARALVEYGTLEVNQALRDFGPVGDLAVKDGRYYPSKAPLLSFAAAPVYAALKVIGGRHRYAVPELALVYWARFFLTVLPTLGMLVLVRRFLRAYVAAGVADAVTAAYALGTLAFSYSLLFMSHQSTAVLLFACFYVLWRVGRGEKGARWYLVAGLAAGAAVAAEYTAALGVAGLVGYGVLGWALRKDLPRRERLVRIGRALGLATLGALPPVLGLMAYHQACYGHPLETGYVNLNDPGYQGWHLGGFLGIRTPDPRAFALSFFSPLRGLFTLSPVLALAVPGLVLLYRSSREDLDRRALFWLSAVLLTGYAYFTSSFSYESWGWTTGPRHMTGLVPFLLLPVALFAERVPPVAAGLAAASVVVTGAVSLVNYVPDSVSNAFYGLALPLYEGGYFPPTAIGWLLPNPWSGALLLAVLVAAAALVIRSLTSASGGRALALAWAACALYLAVLAVLPRNGEADAGAQAHLRAVWLAPPGATVELWPGGL